MSDKLRAVLERQKLEKERILSLKTIDRQENKEAPKYIKNDLVKVITGPRRCGKSVFSFQVLKNQGYTFAYANFEDEALIASLGNDYDKFTDELNFVYGKTDYFVFDEIQNMKKWEMYLNKLQRRDYKVIVTGSNAKLLSGELATSLTGRHISIDLFPFSFQEFLDYKYQNSKPIESQLPYELEYYLKQGGFPETLRSEIDSYSYLNDLLQTTILKDVLFRYGHTIKKGQKMESLANYLINNCCQEISYRRLIVPLGIKSHNTAEKYMGYLQETLLFFTLGKYSFKYSERMSADKKVYVADNGLLTARNLFNSPNFGVYFENLIFLGLLRKNYRPNYELFYYKTKDNKEVDFVLKNLNSQITQLIQVCYDISDANTERREVSALLKASQELKCDNLLIITKDIEKQVNIDDKIIKYIPAWKYLLE